MSTHKPYALLLLSAALLSACASQSDEQALSSDVSSSQVIQEGVPGGVTTEVEQIRAVVSAIDHAKRTFTLQDAQGHRRTLQAVPEMINFPQLKVGDKVKATVTVERVVYLQEPQAMASPDGGAALLATAPAGSKPGMLMADTVEVTAQVVAIDTTQHTATLVFADGSRKLVKVRPDVVLKTEYLNRQLVIRLTSAFAVGVETE